MVNRGLGMGMKVQIRSRGGGAGMMLREEISGKRDGTEG